MLYGSTGYTGSLIAQLAVERGLHPVLAGRNAAKVEKQASELGLNWHAFELGDANGLERAVGEVGIVLHCAGPFIHTAKPMVEACLKVGTHYLDLSGEILSFEIVASYAEEAKARGVTLIPGVGMEVVATDCLAAHLKRRLPGAVHLALGWGGQGPATLSRGSLLTMVEHTGLGRVRRNGRIEAVPASWKCRTIKLGGNQVKATTFPWPDIFTAYFSTGIPNVDVYYRIPRELHRLLRAERYLGSVLTTPRRKQFIKHIVQSMPLGPTEKERAQTRTYIWGQAEDELGHTTVSRIEGPQGYSWSCLTALGVVQKLQEGAAPIGFQTPATAFGADFVSECGQVTREDDTP